ncbi:MAG: hypothetical protein P9F75_07605 [Candidatus Contendobacter sp.]|nr:hypothetical protein [Candidatus Contendobacter sp.]
MKAEGHGGERQDVGSQDAKALKPAGREEAGWMKGSDDGNWKLEIEHRKSGKRNGVEIPRAGKWHEETVAEADG